MAQNTKDIKRRIQGISSIMQITNAMELVSSAKLRKARERLDVTKPYFQTVYRNINEILGSSNIKSPLMQVRKVKKRAVVIIASDKGLAGGYNINVVKKALKFIEKNSDADNQIYTTGIRSIELIKRKGYEINTDFTHLNNDPEIEDAIDLGQYLTNSFESKKYDEIVIFYTKFNSVVSLEPEMIKLLPISGFSDSENPKKLDYEFEPSPSVVLSQMIKQYVNVTIFGCLLESSAAEQASRRTAMENATSNGEELLEDLQLEYNRARQASITQEISEIVGGAEALN